MLGKQGRTTLTMSRGAIATSSVMLLSALLSGALLYSFTMMTSLTYQAHHHRKYLNALGEIEFDILSVAHTLRLNNLSEANLPNSTQVSTTRLISKNNAPVTLFSISVSSSEIPLTVSRDYLRYPALLNVPINSENTQPNADLSSVLQHLFNRDITEFTPEYFAEVATPSSCELDVPNVVIWNQGNCTVTLYKDIGTQEKPVLIIIENGHLNINGSGTVWGLIVLLERTTTSEPSITMSERVVVNGAIVTNALHPSMQSGKAVFNLALLQRLQQANFLAKMIPVPGSWRDHAHE